MISRRDLLLILLAGFGLPAFSDAVLADSGKGGGGGGGGGHDDDDDDHDDKDDYQKARAAVRNGQAASLKDILRIVRRKYSGTVVRVRLSGSGGGLLYRIRLLTANNQVIEIRVNAVTGQIVGARGV